MEKVFTTSSSTQTKKFAEKFAGRVKNHEKAFAIGLQGDLGSGKTTFVQGFAKGFGVKEKVLSPTFVIMKKYGTLYHIDCYRLENSKELRELGWDKIMSDPQNIILIEWPERVQNVLPKDMVMIGFETINKNTRKICITTPPI